MAIKRSNISASKYAEPDEPEDYDFGSEAEEFEEDEPEAPAPAARRKTAAKPAQRRAKPAPVEDEDEDDDSDQYEDEDEDETPKVGTSIQSGWGAAEKVAEQTKSDDFAADFKFTDDEQLIKFIGSAPFATWAQHWIDNPPAKITKKKSFVCLTSVGGKRCPLCDIGDKPRGRFAFTVVTIEGESEVSEPQALYASPTLYEALKAKNKAKSGPLDKHYYSASKTGEGTSTKHILDVVRATELAEEWELDAGAIEDALEGVEPLTSDIVQVTPLKELAEIARSIA